MLIVCGTFDSDGGKPSSLMAKLANSMTDSMLVNGGNLADLAAAFAKVREHPVILWAPNVSNDLGKYLPEIKKVNPRAILIQTKRAVEKSYGAQDVVGRMLASHSNLGIMFTEGAGDREAKYQFSLLDPLGNCHYSGSDIEALGTALKTRIGFLKGLTRLPSRSVGQRKPFSIDPLFLQVVSEFGELFSQHLTAVNPNRLLGNASTRCMSGFPGVRAEQRLFVSRRNVEKHGISNSDFVEVEKNESEVCFYGDNKPSVDSPIQIRLFNHFPNISYMIHGHVYISGAQYASHKIPCGAVEEADEIFKMFPKDAKEFVVNLRGHGCLICASSTDYFEEQKSKMLSRPMPED